jgi:CheY-like chemotaxis protein
MENRPLTILLAEDDPDDAELIGIALQRSKLPHALHHVRDGEAAILYLAGEDRSSNGDQFPRPDVFLLDLKMPRKNGFEVLQWLRSRGDWTGLPVVILTSSDEPSDIRRARDLGATSYLTKSASFQNVLDLLGTLTPPES